MMKDSQLYMYGENMLLQMLRLKGIRIQRWKLRDSIQRKGANGASESKNDGTKSFMPHGYK